MPALCGLCFIPSGGEEVRQRLFCLTTCRSFLPLFSQNQLLVLIRFPDPFVNPKEGATHCETQNLSLPGYLSSH
jgi:hypothetical protein